jgi:hypothetical protein
LDFCGARDNRQRLASFGIRRQDGKLNNVTYRGEKKDQQEGFERAVKRTRRGGQKRLEFEIVCLRLDKLYQSSGLTNLSNRADFKRSTGMKTNR